MCFYSIKLLTHILTRPTLACEQAVLFRASETSLARTRERAAKSRGACSQARPPQMATSIQWLSLRNRGEKKKKTLKTDFTRTEHDLIEMPYLAMAQTPLGSHSRLNLTQVIFV